MQKTNSYSQKREYEQNSKKQRKQMAEIAHDKEIRKAINICASTIASKYGLTDSNKERLIALIHADKDAVAELPVRINLVVNILEKYGYDKVAAMGIINSNFSLVVQKPVALLHSLSIANQYGFDKNLLINNGSYSNINEKELYALSEELKENGIETTSENILKFNSQVRRDGKMDKLIVIHPLTKSKMLTYRTLYDRKLNSVESNMELSRTK